MDSVNELIKLTFAVGVMLCLVIFTLWDLPVLLVTVPLPFLSFITQFLLLTFLVSTIAVATIVLKWLWTVFKADQSKRHYQHRRRELDLEERQQQMRSRRPPSTDPNMNAAPRQRQTPRRSNIYRPDDFR